MELVACARANGKKRATPTNPNKPRDHRPKAPYQQQQQQQQNNNKEFAKEKNENENEIERGQDSGKVPRSEADGERRQ